MEGFPRKTMRLDLITILDSYMTTTELEQVIREYLLDIYKKEYTGKIEITKIEPVGYHVRLGLSMPEKPLVIYAELDDCEYLKFLKQELKDKRFNLIYYGKLQLIGPYDCGPRNTSCGCHDKG